MKTVYIIGGDILIERMFVQKGYGIAYNAKDADILLWTGGADVDPRMYGHERHPSTYSNIERDLKEERYFKDALPNQLKVGICRGSQFLCVMNGGSLYQDVDRHAIGGTHECDYEDENGMPAFYQVTSTHHQMQDPFSSTRDFEIWGMARLSTYRDHERYVQAAVGERNHPDVEIAYWPSSASLGFQGHPEYDSKECRDLFFTCLDRALHRGDRALNRMEN